LPPRRLRLAQRIQNRLDTLLDSPNSRRISRLGAKGSQRAISLCEVPRQVKRTVTHDAQPILDASCVSESPLYETWHPDRCRAKIHTSESPPKRLAFCQAAQEASSNDRKDRENPASAIGPVCAWLSRAGAREPLGTTRQPELARLFQGAPLPSPSQQPSALVPISCATELASRFEAPPSGRPSLAPRPLR